MDYKRRAKSPIRRLRPFRILCAIIALCACTALCSCKRSNDNTDTAQLPQIVIGSDIYEPYFYLDNDGDYTGIDVELARAVCRRLGYEPRFMQLPWEEKDIYLQNGTVDCLWGSYSMSGREDRYAWAGPYMYSRQIVLVHTDSDIRTLSDLNGRRIAVQATSKPEELLLNHSIEGVDSVKNIYSFSSVEEVFAAFRKGYVDAIAGHEISFRLYMDRRETDYRMLDEYITETGLGVAFDRDRGDGLAADFSAVLEDFRIDGTTAEILTRYGLDPEKLLVRSSADE